MPDGVFVPTASGARFVPAPVPTREALEAFAEALAGAVHRACVQWQRTLEPTEADRAAEWLDRLAQEAEVETGPKPSRSERVVRRHRRWVARCAGLEVHAGVSVAADDRRGRERLVRYTARAAVSLQRLSLDDEGRVCIRFKQPWRSGQVGVRLRPEVFVLRLASLLLPPGVNRVRYLGVFGAAARLRPHVVPQPPADAVSRPAGRWVPWRVLLLYTFGVDPTRCPRCGQPLRTVATLLSSVRTFVALRWVRRGRGPPGLAVGVGP